MADWPMYPVNRKLAVLAAERRAINEFVEWLDEHDMHICRSFEGTEAMYPTSRSVDSMVMEMYGIDEKELERERRQMLKALAGDG